MERSRTNPASRDPRQQLRVREGAAVARAGNASPAINPTGQVAAGLVPSAGQKDPQRPDFSQE
jgi:hypothetical protein